MKSQNTFLYSSVLGLTMMCSDLKKAYLLASVPQWVIICGGGGLTLSHHLPRLLMGLEGKNE